MGWRPNPRTTGIPAGHELASCSDCRGFARAPVMLPVLEMGVTSRLSCVEASRGVSWGKRRFHTSDCLNLAMWNKIKYELISKSSSRLGQPAEWGVWAQTILTARLYQEQEHIRGSEPASGESEPESSGEAKTLPGDFNFCFKYLAQGHLVRVTNGSGAPGMKAACDSPLQVKQAVSLFTV